MAVKYDLILGLSFGRDMRQGTSLLPKVHVRGSKEMDNGFLRCQCLWTQYVESVVASAAAEIGCSEAQLNRIRTGLVRGSASRNESMGGQFPGVLFPGLKSSPWLDLSDTEIDYTLRSGFPAIEAELRSLLTEQSFSTHPEQGTLATRGQWSVYRFYSKAVPHEGNLKRCPNTAAHLQRIERIGAGSVFFSRLSPGANLTPHCGPHNLRWRAHLGLVIPEGDCVLSVGRDDRKWTAGGVLHFDDSFEHAAWNNTGLDRFVLIVDTWHPDLTPAEIAGYQHVDRRMCEDVPSYAATGTIPKFAG